MPHYIIFKEQHHNAAACYICKRFMDTIHKSRKSIFCQDPPISNMLRETKVTETRTDLPFTSYRLCFCLLKALSERNLAHTETVNLSFHPQIHPFQFGMVGVFSIEAEYKCCRSGLKYLAGICIQVTPGCIVLPVVRRMIFYLP